MPTKTLTSVKINGDLDNDTDTAKPFFNSLADNYERMTSGTTRRIARHLLKNCPSITPSSTILDNATGTGIMIQELLAQYPPEQPRPKINAVDAAPAMISSLESQIAADPTRWQGVSATVMPAETLDFEDESFSHSFTNFGILFFSDPDKAAREIYRTLKPGGTAMVTSWADLGIWDAWLATESKIRPDQPRYEWPVRDDWKEPATIEDVMRKAGFEDTVVYKEESSRREKTVKALVENMSLSFTFSMSLNKWSPAEKKQLVPVLMEHIVKDREHFFVDEQTGEFGVKMVAIVAICRK